MDPVTAFSARLLLGVLVSLIIANEEQKQNNKTAAHLISRCKTLKPLLENLINRQKGYTPECLKDLYDALLEADKVVKKESTRNRFMGLWSSYRDKLDLAARKVDDAISALQLMEAILTREQIQSQRDESRRLHIASMMFDQENFNRLMMENEQLRQGMKELHIKLDGLKGMVAERSLDTPITPPSRSSSFDRVLVELISYCSHYNVEVPCSSDDYNWLSSKSDVICMSARHRIEERQWNAQSVIVKAIRLGVYQTHSSVIKREIMGMRLLASCENFLQLRCCLVKDGELLVAVEKAQHRSLVDFITTPQYARMSLADQVKLCMGMAKGLEYLHNFGFLHCNLQTSNVFVASGLVAKIGGLGHITECENAGLKALGTPMAWCPPEYFIHNQIGTKTDVFALGMVYWHFLHGQEPFNEVDNALDCIVKGRRPDIKPWIEGIFGSVIRGCWNQNPTRRPDCTQLLRDLVDILNNNESDISNISVRPRGSSMRPKFNAERAIRTSSLYEENVVNDFMKQGFNSEKVHKHKSFDAEKTTRRSSLKNFSSMTTITTNYTKSIIGDKVPVIPRMEKDEQERTKLHWCAITCDVDSLRNFLKHTSQLNEPDIFGWTALHYASLSNSVMLCQLLVNSGADVQKTCPIVRMELREQLSPTQLKRINIDLALKGMDFNDGWLPVHLAALCGCQSLVSFFMSDKVILPCAGNRMTVEEMLSMWT